MIKKLFTLMAAAFMFLNIAPTKAAQLDFDDVMPNHWAFNNVKILKDLGVVVGYPDGSFKPDEFVTRAEFSSMAVKALKLPNSSFEPVNYADVPASYWGYKNIQIASNFDLVSGYSNNLFKPNDFVKRAEVISVIMNSLSLEELTNQDAIQTLQDYKDTNLTPEWALVKTAQAKKMDMIVIMPGREGYIEPMRPATRGELAVFLCKMMEAAEKNANEKISASRDKNLVQKERVLKLYDGITLENAYQDGGYVVLPAGTILPMAVITCTMSEKTQTGNDFRARAFKNFVTKDRRLIIPVGSQLTGIFQDIKNARIFVRNTSMVLASDQLRNSKDADDIMAFPAVAHIETKYKGKNIWQKINFYVIKGKTTPVHRSAVEEFILLEPVRIELKEDWVNL